MAGYVRQSTADIVPTATVRAAPINAELNAIRDAFAASGGHKHDGTSAEGDYIPLIADSDTFNKVAIDTANNRVGIFVEVSSAAVEQIRIQDGAIVPVTNNDIDLGTSSLQFKSLYLDGTATIDILQVDESATITANLTVNGNTTLGNAATDTVTVTADVASPLLPSTDDTYDLGAVGSEWRNLYVDGTANIDALVADTADINGGTVDGAVIGGASAAAGTFTSLNASGTATLATVDINAGNIDGTVIGAASAAAITGTTITGTSFVGDITGDVTGNADTATALATARTIGGVSFDGTANINLPGVNAAGNQDTSGTAADATILETARTIGGVSFDGSANINLPGVNTAGNQDTSGNAATATILATARTIAGNSFNGSANITIAATDLSDTDQSLATGDNVTFASVTGNLTGNVTSTGANSFGSLTVSGAATLNGNTIIGNAATDTVTVTADVASNLIPSADSSYSLGDSSNYWSHGYIDAVTTTGNVIVGGDLTVNGTTTTVATTNMTVSDALIELGTGTTGTPANDAGIVIERGDAANAFMGYDESADKFTVGTGTFTGASTGNLSITTGTLVANVEGNVTGNVTGSSGSTTGNAATATALATARTIGGVSFDGTANINLPGVNASGTQDTSGNADTATALATARTIAGQSFDGTGNISIAPTDLTGVNSTATELNIMDGDTSASATTLADADRVVVNDAGTMKQVALTDFETYFEGALDTLSNVTTVGALNSGTITSGFGAIDNGSSAITTTGTVTYGSLSDGTITITGFVDEDDMVSNSATLIPTQQSVEARIQAVSATSNNVTGLNATGTELNTVADFSAVSVDTSTAIASNDALLVFDNGNEIGYRDVDLLDTYFSATTKTLTNKTITSPIITGMHLNDSGFTVEGSGEDGNDTTVAFTNPTADRTITFTDASGTVLLEGKANSIDSDMYVDGSIDQVHLADAIVNEAKMEISNAPTNGYVLTAQSGNTGGLTWAEAASGAPLYAANESSPYDQPSATGANAIAIGDSATADAARALALGPFSYASGVNSVAIGYLSVAATSACISVGKSYASGADSFAAAIGNNTSSYGARNDYSVAIGLQARTNGNYAVAIGNSSRSQGSGSVAFSTSYASGEQSFASGTGDTGGSYGALGLRSTAHGYRSKASNTDTFAAGRLAFATGLYSVAAGSGAVASGSDSVSVGSYSNSTGTASFAFGSNATASGNHSIAGGYLAGASSQYSAAIGSSSAGAGAKTQTGLGAVALGGSYASGTDSFAAAITNNTSSYGATGANSIVMGYQAKATQANGIAIGDRVVATGNPSIAVGRQITASGTGSAAFGINYAGNNIASGESSLIVTRGGVTASGKNSTIFGGYSKATAERSFALGTNAASDSYGKFAFSAKGFSADYNVDGSAQAGLSILSIITTDATSAYLSGSTGATSTNQIILPNNSAYAFSGMIVARQDPATGTACAAWKVEGLIRREANAASTVLVNSALTILDNTPAWDITLTADTTVGALKITATGAAATTIRWVATINTAEVNFLN